MELGLLLEGKGGREGEIETAYVCVYVALAVRLYAFFVWERRRKTKAERMKRKCTICDTSICLLHVFVCVYVCVCLHVKQSEPKNEKSKKHAQG